jgi:CubicO group peptidase (beta-lactamase class C family)
VGRWRHANAGFARAAALVECLSGMDLERYLRRHVWGAAGWAATGLEPGSIAPSVSWAVALPRVRMSDGRIVAALAPQDRVAPNPWSGRLRDLQATCCGGA